MVNANLYFMEIKRFRNSMFIWAIVISVLIIIDMALFQVFIKEGMLEKIKPVLNSPFMAPMMKGFGLEVSKLSDILGFYVIRNTPLILLLTGIFSIITSVSLFANEEFEKTAEFLYTKPLTRTEIFLSKALAAISLIIILNFITIVIGFISLEVFKMQDYSRVTFFVHSIYGFLTSFVFAAMGIALAAIVKRGRGLFPLSIGIVLATYFLDLISKVTKSAEFLGYFSPFKYVDTNVLVPDYSIASSEILFFAISTVLLFIFSFRIFLKKDILN